jgi:hypothetical protein
MPDEPEPKPAERAKWRRVPLHLAHPICVEPIIVGAPDEEERWPRNALYRDGLGAFCEVRIAIRRAQICRAILIRRHVLPTGFSTWESTRPTLDTAQRVVDRARPALLIGFYGPLKQKDTYAPLERESYHDRAIREAEPLVDALGTIQLEEWSKMSGSERWKLARGLPEIDDYQMTHTLLEFSYIEAKGASALLKLSAEDQRIVIAGSYACRRLDGMADAAVHDCVGNTFILDDEVRRERAEHERMIANLCNDLGEHDLGEKVQAAIDNPATEATFPQSVLYDRFKGHLIEAINKRWPQGDATVVPGPLTSDEIQRLCTAGEDQATEFKDSRVEARAVAKEVAAMLHNSRGGRILVGVSDDGSIVGCSATRQEFDQSLQNALRNSVRPAPTAAVHEVPIDAKRVLVVVVPSWNRQHVYQYDTRIFVRKGTNVFAADTEECRRLYNGQCLPDC